MFQKCLFALCLLSASVVGTILFGTSQAHLAARSSTQVNVRVVTCPKDGNDMILSSTPGKAPVVTITIPNNFCKKTYNKATVVSTSWKICLSVIKLDGTRAGGYCKTHAYPGLFKGAATNPTTEINKEIAACKGVKPGQTEDRNITIRQYIKFKVRVPNNPELTTGAYPYGHAITVTCSDPKPQLPF